MTRIDFACSSSIVLLIHTLKLEVCHLHLFLNPFISLQSLKVSRNVPSRWLMTKIKLNRGQIPPHSSRYELKNELYKNAWFWLFSLYLSVCLYSACFSLYLPTPYYVCNCICCSCVSSWWNVLHPLLPRSSAFPF